MAVGPAGRAPRVHRAGLGCALGLSLFALGLTPSLAQTQATRTEGRNFSIAFESGDATRNGYMDAQLQGTYYFAVCSQVAFLARFNATPHMLVGNHRYWVDGRQVSVPPHINPPRIQNPTIRGTIRGPETVLTIAYVHATSAPTPSCLTNDLSLGVPTKFWPAGTPRDRQLAILNQFGFDQQGTMPPLRNSEVEAHFRQIFAQERTDSANKARATEQQRIAAQCDSTARARAAQARQDSIARTEAQRRAAQSAGSGAQGGAQGGAVSGATGAGANSTAGSGTSTGAGTPDAPRAVSQAERDAQLRAEREAAADAAAADARIRQQHAAEQQRLRAEQEQQLVQAVETGTIAVLGMFESIAESRRASAEKKRVQAEIAARQATARYAAYAAASKARFDASPAQPVCGRADIRDSIVVSRSTEQRTLRLTGSECRLGQGQSAIPIILVVDADAPVILTPESSPLITNLHLLEEGTNRAIIARHEGQLAMNLAPGRYVLVVSSRLPGEVGEVKLATRKGWVSDAQGSVGGAGGSAKQIDGFVGTNQTSSAFMDLNLALQHRRGFPYLVTTILTATDSDAQEFMVDVGLRQYIGSVTGRFTPWVGASLGYRNISVRAEPFTTISPALGAGANWRFAPGSGYGLALSATQILGSARNDDDAIWNIPPPPVPLNRTIFRFGLMIF